MKKWKILRDCHQEGDGLHHAVQAAATNVTRERHFRPETERRTLP